MIKSTLMRWPLMRQIVEGGDGTGREAMSDQTKQLARRNQGAEVRRSVCPYCAVGCGQLIFHRDGKLVSIEGDPQSPISRGHLCPKGSATFELHTHSQRLKKVRYRRAGGTQWEDISWDQALTEIAQKIKKTRDDSFIEKDAKGVTVNRTEAISWIGGCTDTNEFNYLVVKAMRALGVVHLENQARV